MGGAYPGGGRGTAGCQNSALLDLARTLEIIPSNLLILVCRNGLREGVKLTHTCPGVEASL